jgi:hypothetical protein
MTEYPKTSRANLKRSPKPWKIRAAVNCPQTASSEAPSMLTDRLFGIRDERVRAPP